MMKAQNMHEQVACLLVQVEEVSPPIQRRVLVPFAMRMDDLHFVLQIAIGWQNCHPFEFEAGGKTWGLVDRESSENPLPAESVTLADIAQLGSTFRYGYVFGEDWQHQVTIEYVVNAEPGATYPQMLEAKRRCPPADIGGPEGYDRYLQALRDPEHWHHEAMVEWDDPNFDPEDPGLVALQSNLANLAKYIGRRKIIP
jgi:hypothetical protein